MILSIGIILTPWDWGFGWEADDDLSILVLGPLVMAVESVNEW